MTQNRSRDHSFAIFSLCLLGVLLLLFHNSLVPSKVVFSNDGPLGAMNQQAIRLPSAFTGVWYDLNAIGNSGGMSNPNLSQGSFWLLKPLYYSKFFPPLVVLFLGLCAWVFFRQLKLSALACSLGGLSVALNSDFFSVACWGVVQQTLCFGFNFLAYAALAAKLPRWPWLRFILAGLALGMGVMEGADIGVIFSLYFAAYVFYSALSEEGPVPKKVALGIGRVSLVAAFAIFIAAQQISVQIGTAISGVAGAQQTAEARAARWDWATQWSLPKKETLSLVVPGLFGYRMTSSQEGIEGGDYWGAVGRDPAWDRYFEHQNESPPIPQGRMMRQNGGGVYAGVLVVLVALWASLQSLRRKDSLFTLPQRKLIWFWMGVVLVSLLFAFGRFAPFYRILYGLPYVSTIRSPAKHLHLCSFATVVLFAYGIHGLWRRYFEVQPAKAPDQGKRSQNWWAKTSIFDKRWVQGCLIALGAGLLGWLLYASSREGLVTYLTQIFSLEGRKTEDATALAQVTAGFSIRQVGWFILFFVLSVGLFLLIVSGVFRGARARWGAILFGLVLVIDQGRADLPWIQYWDYKEKYSSDPVIELLRQNAHEHRVALLPLRAPPQVALLDQFYRIQWAQHQFQYYNIQSLDVVQNPRPPEDLVAFETAMGSDGSSNTIYRVTRRWQLTSTRYFLGWTGFLNFLNEQLDPVQHRFRIAATFALQPKPGIPNAQRYEEITAGLSTNGPYALFEFTGALPRAKLFANWQVTTNYQSALQQIASPAFDPEKSVIVDRPLPPASPGSVTNQDAGTVRFSNYHPNDILLDADARIASVLLLNDRFDPDWKVFVDGKPETVLRCNYIMRGVFLGPGAHKVEFRFQPAMRAFYVSLAAIILGLGLVGFLAFSKRQEENAVKESDRPPNRPVNAKK